MDNGSQNLPQKLGSAGVSWLSGIKEYFAFVKNRREDQRFSIFPDWLQLAQALAIFASVIAFIVIVIDPVFLDWVKSPEFEKTAFWNALTQLGASGWILYLSGGVLIVLSIVTASRFTGAKHLVWHRIFLHAWYIFTAIALSGLLTNLLKTIFARARPEAATIEQVWLSSHLTDHYLFGSFPSGHATTAGAMAVALALLFPRIRYFMLLLGVWIASSRGALGVHFPSDVIAGLCVGGSFSYFWARYFAKKRFLFCFSDTGGLELRGEGRGHMHKLPSMVSDAIRAGNNAK